MSPSCNKYCFLRNFFGIKNWPEDLASYDLGGREVQVIPIPGHQQSSLAFYDNTSKLFLTGDTFYPGRLYVEDWKTFRLSVGRLFEFAKTHTISYILGNHIEMSTEPGIDYPTGTTFQPQEQKLPLTVDDLLELKLSLDKLGDKPSREVHDKFIIYPK